MGEEMDRKVTVPHSPGLAALLRSAGMRGLGHLANCASRERGGSDEFYVRASLNPGLARAGNPLSAEEAAAALLPVLGRARAAGDPAAPLLARVIRQLGGRVPPEPGAAA